MPGSAVQACWTRVEPSSPHHGPMTLVAVSMTRRVPASWEMGSGCGVRMQPYPAVGGGRDPVPLVIGVAEAVPGLGGDLDADAQGPAAFVELPQRDLAGHGRVVVAGQQDRPRLGDHAGGGMGEQLGDGEGLSLRRPTAGWCLPG